MVLIHCSKDRETTLLVEEVEAIKVALKDLRMWVSMEKTMKTMWRQNSQEIWLRKGVKTPKFSSK